MVNKGTNKTTIMIAEDTWKALFKLKVSPSQTYNDIIVQLIDVAPDDIWKKRGEDNEEKHDIQ